MFKAKVRITANEIKKYVEEHTKRMSLDIKILKNKNRSLSSKVLRLEKCINEMKGK